MSVTHFATMQEAADWIEARMAEGDSEFVMASLADICRATTSPTPKEKSILLEFLTNVANC